MKTIFISQSNYIPWKGFFDAIRAADEYVVLDEVQYTRRDWRNRNRVKTPQGVSWLTIPVNADNHHDMKISQVLTADPKWAVKHWRTLQANYARSPFFKQYAGLIEELYLKETPESLSLINMRFLRAICGILEIDTPFLSSADFRLVDDPTGRLVQICIARGATDYLTGPRAKNYIDESQFREAGIRVHYFDFTGYSEYPQMHGEFAHDVTVLDLLFHTGENALKYLKDLRIDVNTDLSINL